MLLLPLIAMCFQLSLWGAKYGGQPSLSKQNTGNAGTIKVRVLRKDICCHEIITDGMVVRTVTSQCRGYGFNSPIRLGSPCVCVLLPPKDMKLGRLG